MYIVGGDKDDLIQEGMIGLYKAVTTYDELKRLRLLHLPHYVLTDSL